MALCEYALMLRFHRALSGLAAFTHLSKRTWTPSVQLTGCSLTLTNRCLPRSVRGF